METERICSSCQKPLPPDVPLGLCPECLMKAGLNTGTQPGRESGAPSGFVPPSVAELARLFPQLEILEFIGKGGMGAVYKARQPALDRFVALKILPPAAAGDPGFAERFNREARALARLNHPNIVTVYDFGRVKGGIGEPSASPAAGAATASPEPLHYLLMEFVDGGNLRQIERAGRLKPEQALAIVPQICEALQFAHNEGIVHRDIKPENILLDKRGRVKITDFGIAKILGRTTEAAPLTGARDVMGTPHYMAPEQIEKPQTVDHRADIYSLGVVFYEMLTGELPLGKFAPPSRKVQVDVRLDEVVLHALEKEPELRYQQAGEVKTAVETIAKSEGRSQEAEGPLGTPEGDALEQELLPRDYVLDIGSCIRRGWSLAWGDFWPVIATTALVLVLVAAACSICDVSRSASSTEIVAYGLSFFLSGPLWGGLYCYFLKRIRGERVRVETAFAGFRSSFLQLALAGFVSSVLTILGFIFCVIPAVYLYVAWSFVYPLVIDKRLEFWPAMRLSRRLIHKHWWKFLGFHLALLLLNLAGLLAFVVGLFITLPVSLAALMYAYEDIFNPGGQSAAASVTSAPGAPQPELAAAGPPRQGWLTAVVASTLSLVLLAVATLACFAGNTAGYCVAAGAAALALVMLLLLSNSPGPRAFLGPFLLVFLLVFGVATGITALIPDGYLSTARIKLTSQRPGSPATNSAALPAASYDPYLIETELQVMDSEQILNPIIQALDLGHRWAKGSGAGQSLTPAETLAILKSKLRIEPRRNAGIIAISAYSEDPKEAADLANGVVQSYLEHNQDAPFQATIIDRAQPSFRPSRPNKPLNLALGALAGLVLGTAYGAARAVRRRERGSTASGPMA